MKDLLVRVAIGGMLMVCGLICVAMPAQVYSFILDLTVVYCLLNCVYLAYMYSKEKKKVDLLFSVLSFFFVIVLKEYTHFPEWIIRVTFGAYCLVCALAMLVQYVLHVINHIPGKIGFLFLTLLYALLGGFLLFNPEFETGLLMRFFGLYFVVLGIQYLHDAWESVQPEVRYRWKRHIRIMLPPVLCVFFPDWAIRSVNKYLSEGKTPELYDRKWTSRRR